jgi:multisubunit Na+/H+ antiporter MnhB subunit
VWIIKQSLVSFYTGLEISGAVGAWLFICELLAFERRKEKDKRSLHLFLVYVGCVLGFSFVNCSLLREEKKMIREACTCSWFM